MHINNTMQKSLQRIAFDNRVSLSYLLKHIEDSYKYPIDAVGMEATLWFDLEAGTYTGRYSRSATGKVLKANPVQRTLDKQSFKFLKWSLL